MVGGGGRLADRWPRHVKSLQMSTSLHQVEVLKKRCLEKTQAFSRIPENRRHEPPLLHARHRRAWGSHHNARTKVQSQSSLGHQ